MSQISPFLRRLPVGYGHYCPACKQMHAYYVDKPTFDGNVDSPTFAPSMNISWGNEPRIGRCHYFVQGGQIKFCSDSTHELAGKTVPLPELPLHYQDPHYTHDEDWGS
jgi:hypothetical protein